VTQRDLFDGETFDPKLDGERLRTLQMRVHAFMENWDCPSPHGEGWRTLTEIARVCGGSEAGVSARLRDLRKTRWGAHTVERRRHPDADGLWLYRVTH